jgi:hypothetical protein
LRKAKGESNAKRRIPIDNPVSHSRNSKVGIGKSGSFARRLESQDVVEIR